jgi:broad specificity phosphatase PhoE
MTKEIELRRHTDNESDELTDEGVQAALQVGPALRGGYELLVSTGAQRATQTLACFACALGERVPVWAVVESGLRSELEDRWRQAYREAGSGELAALHSADPRSGGCSTAWARAARPSSWDTAQPTRPRSGA